MTLAFALAVGGLFGCGAFLLLQADLLRVVAGIIVVSNAAILTVMSAGLSRGEAPIAGAGRAISDPLVQSMALTAVVITFGFVAVLMGLLERVHATHEDADLDELTARETEAEAGREEAGERVTEGARR
jgi:multicomponent Na+:H+ antiporter subunit C